MLKRAKWAWDAGYVFDIKALARADVEAEGIGRPKRHQPARPRGLWWT